MDAADSLFVVRSLLFAINVYMYCKFMLAQKFYLQRVLYTVVQKASAQCYMYGSLGERGTGYM